MSIVSGNEIIAFGGKQLKADGEDLFPESVKTQLFVTQSGPDHTPHVGFVTSIEHGELQGPHTGVYFESQGQVIKPTNSYRLVFAVPVNMATVWGFQLADSADGEEALETFPSKFLHPSIMDANKKGASLVAVMIQLKENAILNLITYPPAVAKGPNYGLVHNDEPFDGGVTISKILSSSRIIAYIPRSHYASISSALSRAEAATPIDPKRPFGIDAMIDYDRGHLERNSDLLFLERQDVPVPVQPVTDWLHLRAAIVMGMGADTLLIQQDIEKLANKPCRAILFREDHGRLIAGFRLPRNEDFRNFPRALNKEGQEIQIYRLQPIVWIPKSGIKKPNTEDRLPFPAKILESPHPGSICPRAATSSQRSIPEEVDLWLRFPDETSQTQRLIARFCQHLDPVERVSENHQTNLDFEGYCTREIGKKRTRNLLCGRGAPEFAFDVDHQLVPPYPGNEVDLVALTGAKAEGDLFNTIISNTIGRLGPYSHLVQSAIRALPDGILSMEAFPGAGKTTVAAAIDACLCLLSSKFRITVIAGQHAALDALNGNLTQRLRSSVTNINKELGSNLSGRTVQLPLVLRTYGNDHAEMMEFVRIIRSQYKSGPDPKRPNTLCEVLLQLLHAGPHHLSAFSKSELSELAASIKSQDSEGFRRLRQFVTGELTWDEANQTTMHLDLQESGQQRGGPSKNTVSDNKLRPRTTAKDALKEIISRILPLVNILVCTTATAAGEAYQGFVDSADLCQNEEAGATSFPEVFAGWRGIGQALIVSGDGAQFGPFMRNYSKHIFQDHLAMSTLDMIKSSGYPTFQLNTQHRAIDGQFEPIYENFYSDFESIESPRSQHPDNHPDAQWVEASFVADFTGLQPSPPGRIIPMFIHVPGSTCEDVVTSKHSPQQNKAATYVVKKLISCGIEPADIMVIGAYKAEIIELRKTIPNDILVATAVSVQGQERPYVVFIFSTTKDTGPGFTKDPHRLCVSMSRHKAFLALVGDIETVDYKNPDSPDRKDTVHLARIHKYFVTNERIGIYEETRAAIRDAVEAPRAPFNVDVSDEEETRLFAQIHAAIIALKDHQESKSKKPAEQLRNDSDRSQQTDEVSQQTKNVTKPMNLRQRMSARMRKVSKLVPGSAADAGNSWSSSENAGSSSGTGTTNKESMECHGCGKSGHFLEECPNPKPATCHNCHEVGHMRWACNNQKKVICFNCDEVGHINKDCPKPKNPEAYSKVQCYRCKKFGHTATKCDQPDPSQSTDSGFSNFNNTGGDDSTSKYAGW